VAGINSFFGSTLVYTKMSGGKMSNSIENNEGQFANGQSSRDLLINSEPKEMKPEQFPAPIGRLLGLKLLQAENGMAVVEFVADERHANPMGTLTGGVSSLIADVAMGFAYYSTLAADESFTAIELKINFMRPVWKATLRANARVVHAGKLVGLVECDILDERQRLVARASSTCMTLRGQLAEGRQVTDPMTLEHKRQVRTR
jgi:uncharacterized protein (TIGR00369 family)